MAKKQGPSVATADGLLDKAIKEYLPKFQKGLYGKKIEDVPTGREIVAQDAATQAEIVVAALDRLARLEKENRAYRDVGHTRWVLFEALRGLLRRPLPLSEAMVIRLVKWPAPSSRDSLHRIYPLTGLATTVENFAASHEVKGPLRKAIEGLLELLRDDEDEKEVRKAADRFRALVQSGPVVPIEAGEAWSDAALADLEKMKAKPAQAWTALLLHCQAGGKGKLNDRWRAAAQPLIDAVGFESLKEHGLRWLPLVDKPRTRPKVREHRWEQDYTNLIIEPHVELLRGLVWCCGFREDADLARAVARLAISSYRKIPLKGPRLVSLGNACVTALGSMPGRAPIGQLAILKVKVKFGTAQKEIEKAFTASATREGLPRDEIEELAVPSYGLEDVGILRPNFR